MKVGVPKEVRPNERRVALVPESVAKLIAAGLEVIVQEGAGMGAHHADVAYRNAGASLVADAAALYEAADTIVKVQRPTFGDEAGTTEVSMLRPDVVLISILQQLYYPAAGAGLGEPRGHQLQHGRRAPDRAGAVDGCAQLHELHRRIQGRDHSRRGPRHLPAHDGDGRGHDAARQGPRAGRGRRRPAGHRDVAALGRGRLRIRRTARRQGAGGKPWRHVHPGGGPHGGD